MMEDDDDDRSNATVHVFPGCSLPRLSLLDKRRPTVEWYPQSTHSIEDSDASRVRWCATVLDCTQSFQSLRRRVVATPHAQWSDEYQVAHGNVTLTRAAHDKLGVNKIVLRFSDDIFTTVYQTPAWDDWYVPHIQPLLASLGLRSSQIVRMMLARIPPGAHITMHHDTGRWTTRTHRMHVPIVTNENVVFRVGPGPHHMVRYDFKAGR